MLVHPVDAADGSACEANEAFRHRQRHHEALAQTGAVALLSMPANKGKIALFGGIKNARFKKQVRPGDVLELHCELTRMHGPVGMGTAVATVNGKTAVQAELTFAVQ